MSDTQGKYAQAFKKIAHLQQRPARLEIDGRTYNAFIFDLHRADPEALSGLLEETFGDGFLPGYLATDGDGATRWAHPTQVPFALLALTPLEVDWEAPDLGDVGQLDGMLLFDLAALKGQDAAVRLIDIDGTAIQTAGVKKVATTVAALNPELGSIEAGEDAEDDDDGDDEDDEDEDTEEFDSDDIDTAESEMADGEGPETEDDR